LSSDARERERSLFATIRWFARRRSDGALALIASAGLTGVTLTAMYFPGLWRAGLAFVVIAAFGCWGIFDRSPNAWPWLSAPAKFLIAATGSVAAFVLLFSAFEYALLNLRH
jgi:hypothetical protein